MCIRPWFKTDIKKTIPCGGCLGCRIDRMKLWKARAESEMIKGRNAFITLTYDNAHLNYGKNGYTPTLKKEEAHKFLDNLRHQIKKMETLPKGCKKDYKYYLVGEYGGKLKRPHLHILIFGLDFKTMNKTIAKIWSKGNTDNQPIDTKRINYVMDYIMKNQNGKNAEELYDAKGIERPFTMVSKGFGKEFFEAHKEEISKTGIIKIGARMVQVPTYYKNTIQSYKKEDIEERRRLKTENYQRKLKEIQAMGFNDMQQYLNTTRRARDKKLTLESRDKGKPTDIKFMLEEIPEGDIITKEVKHDL